MKIPADYYKTDTVHHTLTNSGESGILSCGFLLKNDSNSDRNICFTHYGALLLLDGTGEYVEASGETRLLVPGSFIQRLPGVSHSTLVKPGTPWLEFFVCFGREMYEAMASLGMLSREPVLFPGVNEQLVSQCGRLLAFAQKAPDSQLPFLFLEVQQFLFDVLEAHRRNALGTLKRPLEEAAGILCTANPNYPSPAQAAKQVGMEYEYFRKQFKAAFGCPPGAYQLRHRLNFSKQLLLGCTDSIEKIAQQCCFSDGFAYSKAFRKHFGISPSAFRKSHL